MSVLVNKAEITDEMIYAEMQYHPAASAEEAQAQATEALIVRELLLQELEEQKISAGDIRGLSPEAEEKLIDNLIKEKVKLPQADEASCQHYYESNKQKFTDTKSGAVLPFEQVSAQIRDYLYTQSLYTGVNQYIKALMDRASIAQ